MTINELFGALASLIQAKADQYTLMNVLDVCNQILTLVKLFGANLGNIALRLLGIEASITAVRTENDLTLQSVIDAMPEGGPVTLPTTPPAGYGGADAAAIWNYPVGAWSWSYAGGGEGASGLLANASAYGTSMIQGAGIVCPAAPDFALVLVDPAALIFTPYHIYPDGWTPPAGVDWSDWDGSETIVAFLNSHTSGITWDYSNLYGETTPGWAWGHVSTWSGLRCWRCLVSDADLPTKAGREPGGLTVAKEYTVLNIALGLAALFAVGGADVSAIVTEVGALLADAADLPAALTSLLDWLAGRDQTTNESQAVQLTTTLADLDALTSTGANTLQTILTPLAQEIIDQADRYNHLTDTSTLNLRNLQDEFDAIRTDDNLTLGSLAETLTRIEGKIDALPVPAPIWPGEDNVTLGEPVALDAGTVIDGPMDGVLLDITAMERLIPYMTMDTHKTYRSLGRIAFEADNGYLEHWRGIPNLHGVITPLHMRQAAKAYIMCYTGVTGTATPWVVNAT